MNKKQLRFVKFFPVQIFILVGLACIMGGWLLGILGWFGFHSPEYGEYVIANGGIRGGSTGLILGGFLSFGSFGLSTGLIWRKRYPNLTLYHLFLLILGWMIIPGFILILILWIPFF